MTEFKFRQILYGEAVYLVLLEFPLEDQNDDNRTWLRALRNEVEGFCNEHCFKIGALHMLPKPYFAIVDSFLRKAKLEYKKRGYSPTFRLLKVNFKDKDYLDLQRLILDRIRSRLESCLSKLESEGSDDYLFSNALKEVTKANELMLIFQLSRVYPEDATRVYDLVSILNEKISEFRLHKPKEVVVTEL